MPSQEPSPRAHLNHDLHSAVGEFLNDRLDPDQGFDLQAEKAVTADPDVSPRSTAHHLFVLGWTRLTWVLRR